MEDLTTLEKDAVMDLKRGKALAWKLMQKGAASIQGDANLNDYTSLVGAFAMK